MVSLQVGLECLPSCELHPFVDLVNHVLNPITNLVEKHPGRFQLIIIDQVLDDDLELLDPRTDYAHGDASSPEAVMMVVVEVSPIPVSADIGPDSRSVAGIVD